MSSGLEPFPLFIDSAPPESANYFSNMRSFQHILAPSSTSRMRKPRISIPTKLSNCMRLRYYQYEVTFGLYVMDPGEKIVLNTIILLVMSALVYALYWGLGLFIIRIVCSIVYHITGSCAPAGELCAQ